MLFLLALAGCGGDTIARDGCHQVFVNGGGGPSDLYRSVWDLRQVGEGLMFKTRGSESPATRNEGLVYTDLQVQIGYGQGEDCPGMNGEGG